MPALTDANDSLNIKLVKSGGACAAREAMAQTRRLGPRVMLGSTIESSLSIAAAAHLADGINLDGNLLLSDAPFDSHSIENGRIMLRDPPELGIDEPVDG